jgi:hypothetical protein
MLNFFDQEGWRFAKGTFSIITAKIMLKYQVRNGYARFKSNLNIELKSEKSNNNKRKIT